MASPKNILLFGPQGSGKGTQGEKLSKHFTIPLFGGGELLREEAAKDTERGRFVGEVLKTGALLPNEITNALVFDRLKKPDTEDGFISDGYPRNKIQEEALRAFLPTLRGGAGITHVIVLELSDDAAIVRLAGRRLCPKCEAIYHIANKPPKKEGVCDACGGKLIQRSDDTPEAIRKRLGIYHADTAPLLKDYERDGVVVRIPADGEITDVFRRMVQAIEEK
ncbi:MAG: nucleoside monophosphate kinase [bacterium]|nr:nucleoside monophosphate kinase [bacterium]